MMKLPSLNLSRLTPKGRQPGSTVLGLSLDGSRLEAVLVRRTNGSVEIQKQFSATLSLDPLTNAPDLVGRELRKLLDEHAIKERWCAVCLPLNWALSLTVKLPELPEADVASFLQLEAERGFPYGPEALVTATSRFTAPDNSAWATLIAIPRHHLERIEKVLAAAQLRPTNFSLALPALVAAGNEQNSGVLALWPGESNVSLQVSLGGGILLLRTVEGAFELEGTERQLQGDHVLREARVTLGQLPPEIREAIGQVRVLGKGDDAEELAETIQPRLRDMGLPLEQVRLHAAEDFGVKVPVNTAISPAFAVAARRLTGRNGPLNFLPPRISAWQQFSSKYSSPRLVTVGATAGAVAALVLLAFVVQQVQLWYWGAKWNAMKQQVYALEDVQANIRQYRPWFNESFRELTILKRLTESFPEDGLVSVKTVEIRDATKPGEPPTVTCTGTARTRKSLTLVTDILGTNRNVLNVRTEQTRGTTPMEFTFNFQWSEGGP